MDAASQERASKRQTACDTSSSLLVSLCRITIFTDGEARNKISIVDTFLVVILIVRSHGFGRLEVRSVQDSPYTRLNENESITRHPSLTLCIRLYKLLGEANEASKLHVHKQSSWDNPDLRIFVDLVFGGHVRQLSYEGIFMYTQAHR